MKHASDHRAMKKVEGVELLHHRADVHRLMMDLTNLGVHFFIAGGYARDVYHGVKPKDVDICIPIYHTTHTARVTALLWEYLQLMTVASKWTNYTTDGREVFGYKACDGAVDILLFQDTTQWEILGRFDFNINQYTIDEDDQVWFWGTGERTLYQTRDIVGDDRVQYIRDKAVELGWDAWDVTASIEKRLLEKQAPVPELF